MNIAHFISGQRVVGSGSHYGDVFDPSTGRVVKTVTQRWPAPGGEVASSFIIPTMA